MELSESLASWTGFARDGLEAGAAVTVEMGRGGGEAGPGRGENRTPLCCSTPSLGS